MKTRGTFGFMSTQSNRYAKVRRAVADSESPGAHAEFDSDPERADFADLETVTAAPSTSLFSEMPGGT